VRQVRDRRLQGIETVVERQQRVPAKRDDDSLVLDRRVVDFGTIGPVGKSATALRFFGLIP
jgi:hypothetical protein